MIIEYVHFSTTVSTCQRCLLVFFCLSQLRLFDLLPRINIHLSPPRIIPRPIHVQITLELGLPLLKERPDTLLLIPTASPCQHQSTPKEKEQKTYCEANICPKTLDSSKCASSTLPGALHINARFNAPAIGLTSWAISLANSTARFTTPSLVGNVSAKSPPKCGDVGGCTAPVETRYMAREYPMSRGRR